MAKSMKKNFIIIGILVVLIGLLIAWFLLFRNTAPVTQNSNEPSSVLPITNDRTQRGVLEQKIINDFRVQIQNTDAITLYNTIIAGNYALQVWGDENKGGQALLQYKEGQGWLILTMGGGAWDIEGLVGSGVPRVLAEELISKSH